MSQEAGRSTPSPSDEIQVNCTVISAKIRAGLPSARKEHSWSVVFGPKKSQFQTLVSADPSEPRWKDQATLCCQGGELFQFKLKDRKQTVGKYAAPVSQLPREKTPVLLQLTNKHGQVAELRVSCWVSGHLPTPTSPQPPFGSTGVVSGKEQPIPRKSNSTARPPIAPSEGSDFSSLLRGSSLSTARSESSLAARKRSGVVWSSRERLDCPALPQSLSNALGFPAGSSSTLSSGQEAGSLSSLTESLRSQPVYATPNRVPTPALRDVRPRTVFLDRPNRMLITGDYLCQVQGDILELRLGRVSCLEYIQSAGPSEISLLVPAHLSAHEHKGHVFLHSRQGTCEAPTLQISFLQSIQLEGRDSNSSRQSLNSESPASSSDDVRMRPHSFQDSVHVANARYTLQQVELQPSPEITGLGPRQSALRGNVQVTLRGNNLGLSRDDVTRVGVAGMDCTSTLEYYSSYKIVVTCLPAKFPCSGPVVVETASGGIGLSGMLFTYVDEDSLGVKEAVAAKSPNKPQQRSMKKGPSQREEQQSKLIQELQSLSSQQKLQLREQQEEIKRLQDYIDKLTLRVLEEKPELLMAVKNSAEN